MPNSKCIGPLLFQTSPTVKRYDPKISHIQAYEITFLHRMYLIYRFLSLKKKFFLFLSK